MDALVPMSSKCSGEVLSGPQKVALAVRKVKNDQARKIVKNSIDRSFGSLRKKRQLTSLSQSFVLNQMLSLRKQNQEVIEEIVKLRQYTTKIENLNLQFQGQQGKFLAKIIHLQEKIKKISAENTSLKRLLGAYQQKYDLGDKTVEASLNFNSDQPERILTNRNNPDCNSSSENSESELSMFNGIERLHSPMPLPCEEVSPEETLPSYVYFSMHEDKVDCSESNQRDATLCQNEFGSMSPVCPNFDVVKNKRSLSLTKPILQQSSGKLISPQCDQSEELQQDGNIINVNSDIDELSLRLPESAESSLISNASLEFEVQSEKSETELTFEEDDKNSLTNCGNSDNSLNNTVEDIMTSSKSSLKTVNSKCTPKNKHNRYSDRLLTESSENVPAEIEKCADDINKTRLKSRNSNVNANKTGRRKKSKPCNKEKTSFDFLSTSKDSFIIDDSKRVKLPRSQSLPGSDHKISCNDENKAPSYRPTRRRAAVSYAEPSLHSKLRRGDKHTDTSLYVTFSPKKK